MIQKLDCSNFSSNFCQIYGLGIRIVLDHIPLKEFETELCGGGALLCAMTETRRKDCDQKSILSSDIDLFVRGKDEATQRKNFEALLEKFESVCGQHNIIYVRKGSSVKLHFRGLAAIVQITTLKDSVTLEDVIGNFDQSCCGFAWDGESLFATEAAILALNTNMNIVNMENFNKLYAYNPDKSMETLLSRVGKMACRGFQTDLRKIDLRSLYKPKPEFVPSFSATIAENQKFANAGDSFGDLFVYRQARAVPMYNEDPATRRR